MPANHIEKTSVDTFEYGFFGAAPSGLDLRWADRPNSSRASRAPDAVAQPGADSHVARSRASEEIAHLGDFADRVDAELDALVLETETALYFFLKRVMDICGAIFALLVLSPLLLLAALVVKLSDGGPVFYVHRRVGLRGREFTCYKFRTMRVDADRFQEELLHLNSHSDPRTFKIPDDPRITRIGRWLRRTSFDEVPQFWNVLRGEMSLVGPRPPVPKEVDLYSARDLRRLEAKPGLTCIWQVSGRSRLPFPQQLEMDIEYIRKRSLLFDLKLIALTIPAVLSADGAC